MRRRTLIMDGWQFTKEDKTVTVDLPHTWNNFDGQDGGNDYYRGSCTYEKKLNSPDFNPQTEAVFLEFEGVNSSAKVYINDSLIAVHHGGYSTFRAEATSFIKTKEDNTIFIEVDNSVNNTVYPQKADFTFYGGIYRDVNWLVVDKSHFEVRRFGTPGLWVDQSVDTKGDANISVKAFLSIAPGDDNCLVDFEIRDMEGNVLETNSDTVNSELEEIKADFTIQNPHLWKGLEDPYLYKVVCRLLRNNEVIDEISTDFGIRTIKVYKDKGVYLNGEPYPMRGVARHQDRKDLGNAITTKMMEEDMALIKEIGANCIRLAHYQHSQHFYDLCDREGMLVWTEIPYISSYMSGADDNTQSQMQELIYQNINHPSIMTWGISNEITIDNAKSRGANLKNHQRLHDMIHSLDPSRPTSIACYAMCTPFHPVTRIPDIVAWNLYLGWYVPGLFLNDVFMWFYHTFFKKPLGYSEYGAEGMPNLHSKKPKRGDHSEEYQARYHEYMLECFDRHPYLWSTFVWNMFDFAADARDQGGEPGMNHKGLVTFDRTIKKDSFYLYKAWWSEEPFVHITSKRFVYRNEDKISVKVYSNLSRVSLLVDGKTFETKEGEKIFEFTDVPIGASTQVKAVAGSLEDTAEFKYTTTKHWEYVLKRDKKSNAANWT